MYLKKITIVLVSLLFVGCVSIPPEAPQLSMELGKKISSIESAHINLLNKFFNQKREDVDKFIEDEWIPIFANKVFSNKMVEKYWDEIVKTDDKKERLTFLIKMGPKLQNQINQKRLELIKPLDLLEQKIEQNLRFEYSQARAMNNSITSLLVSASEVVENQNRYLSMVGLNDERVANILDKTDEIVASLLTKSEETEAKGEKFLEKIKELREKIDNKLKDK